MFSWSSVFLLFGIITKLINLTLDIKSSSNLIYAPYLLYFLYIPFTIFFLKRENLDRKTVLVSLGFLYISILITQIYVLLLQEGLGFIFPLLFIYSLCTLFLTIPIFCASLAILKERDLKNKGKLRSPSITVKLTILIVATSIILPILNIIPKKNYLTSITNSQKNFSYCKEVNQITNEYLIYNAISEDVRCNSDKESNSDHIIYKYDFKTKTKKILINNAKNVVNYKNDINNLFFTYQSHGPVYRISNGDKISKLISSENPGPLYNDGDFLYYIDFQDDGFIKKININSGEISKLIAEPQGDFYIVHSDSDHLYLNSFSIADKNLKNITKLPGGQSLYKPYFNDNNFYFFTESSLNIYNLNTKKFEYKSQKKDLFEPVIVGVYNNYLYAFSLDMHKIYYLDLNNKDTGFVSLSDDQIMNGLEYLNNEGSVDLFDNYIYYTNSNDQKNIYRIDLNTKEKQKITNINNCRFVKIVDKYLYYIQFETGDIYRINLNTFQNEKID